MRVPINAISRPWKPGLTPQISVAAWPASESHFPCAEDRQAVRRVKRLQSVCVSPENCTVPLFRGFSLWIFSPMPTRHQLSRYPKHVKAIGMIALETVDLELELALLFSEMLSLPYNVAEAIYMTPRGDQARLDILRNAAKALFAPHPRSKATSPKSKKKASLKSKVLNIISRAQKCTQKRHRAMHDEWYVLPRTREIKRIQVDGTGVEEGTPIPLPQLNDDIRIVRTLIDDITELAKTFGKILPLRLLRTNDSSIKFNDKFRVCRLSC